MHHPQYKPPYIGEMEDTSEMIVQNEKMYHRVRTGDYFMTHFQCDIFYFDHMQGRNPMSHSHRFEDDTLLCAIRHFFFGYLWIWRHGAINNNLIMFKKKHEARDEVLVLVEGLPNLGLFPIKYEFGMRVAYSTLVIYMRKGNNKGHLQWDSMRKSPTAWINIY